MVVNNLTTSLVKNFWNQNLIKNKMHINIRFKKKLIIPWIKALDKEFHKKPLNLMPNIEEETTCYQLLEYFQPHKVKMANTVHNIISKKHGNNVFNIRGVLSDSREQFGFDQLKQGIEEYPVSVSSNGNFIHC